MEQEQDAFERMLKSGFYRFFEGAARLIQVNLCIVLLTLCGLCVFGFFPAVFAAAAYFNDVLQGKEGRLLKEMFWYFKKYFRIGNLLMLLTAPAIGLGFYAVYGKELNTAAYFLLFTWMILAMVLCWYLPAVNVLYPGFSAGKKLLFSLVAACDRWMLTILFLVMNLLWLYAVLLLPQFLLFVVFSAPVWFGVWRIRAALSAGLDEVAERTGKDSSGEKHQ